MAAVKTRSRPFLGALALLLLVAAASCGRQRELLGEGAAKLNIPIPVLEIKLSPPEPYVPLAGEPIPEVKQLAADVLQAIGTYEEGGGTIEGATTRLAGRAAPAIVQNAVPLLKPDVASAVDIVYPQVSGLTATQAGIMAVFRQRTLQNREEKSVTEVADLRFKKTPAGWVVSELVTTGGSLPPAPAKPLSAPAQAVLDSDRINLPDPARRDIEGGAVDNRVLQVLLGLAEQRTLDVTVFASGHPRNVFGLNRVSNHTVGRAVDIWAVDGMPVITQQEQSGPLYPLMRPLLSQGITELGTPWDVDGPKAGASFTNTVHLDHLHLGFDR